MGKTYRLALILIFTSCLAACSALDVQPVTKPMVPSPLPTYKVGDKFVSKVAIVKDEQEVVAVNDKTVTIKSSAFGTLTQYREFSTPENWTGEYTQAYSTTPDQVLSGLFPLKVGNRVSGTGSFSYNSTGTYERTCIVEDQVRATVPAGSFETYQVVCEMEYSYPSGTSSELDLIWYSPEINHWVAILRHGRMFVLLSYDKN